MNDVIWTVHVDDCQLNKRQPDVEFLIYEGHLEISKHGIITQQCIDKCYQN